LRWRRWRQNLRAALINGEKFGQRALADSLFFNGGLPDSDFLSPFRSMRRSGTPRNSLACSRFRREPDAFAIAGREMNVVFFLMARATMEAEA
jgi:hypothetical protein